jgi:hypothetical protein
MRPISIQKPLPRANLLRIKAAHDEPAVTLQPLMTPARRIALEALEREFEDSLTVDRT